MNQAILAQREATIIEHQVNIIVFCFRCLTIYRIICLIYSSYIKPRFDIFNL